MVAFSRLQLAAALIEYDNDPDNPYAPYKSAQDSAIFAPMRRARGRRTSELRRQSVDYLGVNLPSEAGVSQDPTVTRKSMASVDLLQNPFSAEDDGDERDEEVPEVDLASWGLDSFVPKEKSSKSKGKGKAKSEIVLANERRSSAAMDRPTMPTRAQSEFGIGEAFLESGSMSPGAPGSRRNSLANALAEGSGDEYEHPRARRRQSAHTLLEEMPVKSPMHTSSHLPERDTIPFPTSSPAQDEFGETHPSQGHGRTHSTATMGTLAGKSEQENNLFSVPLPPPSRASRFDPKVQEHMRTMSNATGLSAGLGPRNEADAQVEGDVIAPRSKRLSTASYGTRQMLDNASVLSGDAYEQRERMYTRLELMRPKVLIMPSPLQNAEGGSQTEKPTRTGFVDSSDGRPLPPGARTSRTMSMIFPQAGAVPVASNSFTPNPRLSLSAAQLLFRNTLMVDGQRDVAYNDIDGYMKRAREDGEQVKQEFAEEEIAKPAAPPPPVIVAPPEEEKRSRAPGKLFGRSLMDDLEARKAAMRNKQRVFTGDQRPSMMDRTAKTASTLIDPASLQRRPTAHGTETLGVDETGLKRRGSRGSKPLLAFDDNGKLAETGVRDSQIPKTKSVFGVDMLWEREMEKLKIIEEQERKEAEEMERQEQLDQSKRKRKKGKGKRAEEEVPASESTLLKPPEEPGLVRQSSLPHVLPDIPSTVPRRKQTHGSANDDSDDESSASEVDGVGNNKSVRGRDQVADKWVADDDDDDEAGPLRTTGVGPRYPNRLKGNTSSAMDDDSDEDIPLSVAAQRATQFLSPRGPRAPRAVSDDEDEDRPLSTLLDKSKSSSFSIDFGNLSPSSQQPRSQLKVPATGQGDTDDDDVPLGLRTSKVLSSPQNSRAGLGGGDADDDDDDRPLGMHPEAQRKTQFNMLAQQQFMQNQFQSPFGMAPAPFVGAPFTPFGPPAPPMAPMMMMPPQPPALPQDAAKFGRVDRWRHDVAVEGSTN